MVDLFPLLKKKKLHTPRDDTSYLIPAKAIQDTERILREYGNVICPNEGLVYWGGFKNKNIITISMVIAPATESGTGRVSTHNRSNFDVVRVLNKNNFVQIAQVHSHPHKWVDHSPGDDRLAAFRINGLLSVVVPDYCQVGMLPLPLCGVHRYVNSVFIRLSKKYITSHFKIVSNIESQLKDLRR
jgi:hypothetical protein